MVVMIARNFDQNISATIRKFMVVAVIAAFAVPAMPQLAFALSCMRPNLVASYHAWQKSPDQLFILRGSMTPIGKVPEQISQNGQKPKRPKAAKYEFEGVMIGESKNAPFSRQVIVHPNCIASWCGSYPTGNEPILAAFKKTQKGYILETSPCPGDVFRGNMAEMEQTIRNCMKGVACKMQKLQKIPMKKPPIKIQIK